jgi:asparagine synthase (glutamine-hydrolysing)
MTKICGLVSSNPDLRVPQVLDRMVEACRRPGTLRRDVWSQGPAALGHVSLGVFNPEPQPLFTSDRKQAIVYCGKIFDYGDLKRDLKRRGVRFRYRENDAEFLLHLLRETGTEHLAELNGLYSAACWDGPARRLWLMTDRYGFRMIYYHHDAAQQALVFSSRLRSVVDSGVLRPEANWAAWSAFLYFGHCLGDETFFRNVFVVPPGSVLRFERNEVSLERYWDPNSVQVDETMTRDRAVEGMAELFAQAVRRRNVPTNGRKAVFLSGGLDSRRIAAELARQGAEFSTYTTRGFRPSDEDRAPARQVARSIGVANTFINLPSEGFLTDYWPRSNSLTDYETNLHHAILPLIDALPDDIDVNYDGIAGDITTNVVQRVSCFSDPEVFRVARGLGPEDVARMAIGPERDFSVLDKRLRKGLRYEEVVAAVAFELHKYGRTENRLAWFYLLNRTRRAISLSPFRLVSLKAESFCPYLDNDFQNFIMQIPVDLRIRCRLREAAVRYAYPELTEIDQASHRRAARKPGSGDDINYHGQRRRWAHSNAWQHFVRNNWLFDNRHALPRVIQAVAMSWRPNFRSYLFSTTFLLFYEWMERYRRFLCEAQPVHLGGREGPTGDPEAASAP